MGYYDHHPTVQIDKPFALVGFAGSGVQQITHFLARTTGLPFSDIERQVEHDASRSLSQVHIEEGEAAWRKMERQAVRRELNSSPHRLICLGEGSLINRELADEVFAKAHVVYIRRAREHLLRRIHRGLRENPSRFPLFLNSFPISAMTLEPLLALREPVYERAQTMLDAGDFGPVEMALQVARRLGWSSV